jgi:hypothetical protein
MCYWEHLGDSIFRTLWEYDGNKGKKNKNSISSCPLKKKKTGPSMSAC